MSDTPRTGMELLRESGLTIGEVIDRLERENAALRAELEEARKDAERYMWLREHNDSMSLEPPLTVARVAGWGLEAWSGDDLDAAIDAAIAQGNGQDVPVERES